MTDMHSHPHPEEHRREEDHRAIARVAYSPWANIAHLAATATLLLSVIGFGAQFYTQVYSNDMRTEENKKDVAALDTESAQIKSRVVTLEQAVKTNRKDIDRVEEQAAEDRGEILQRLESLNNNMIELNRYLRDNSVHGGLIMRPHLIGHQDDT